MGLSRRPAAPSRQASHHESRFTQFKPSFRKLALSILAVAIVILAGAGDAAAQSDEVECSSLRLQNSDSGYDNTCELYNSSSDEVQVLETNAIDGSHFLVVIDHMTSHRYIFRGGGALQSSLKDYFNKLDIDKWKSGDAHLGFRTGEFVSDFKSIPSECVAFEKYLRREWGGWRRRIIGFGCSRDGDREQVYAAMRLVNFPE